MRVLDLFSGIGGFSLGLRMAGGFETVQFCEIDPYCQKVLAKNFPGVPIHDDIRSFRPAHGSADLICGGFPCQPFSVAGKRAGTADDRDLWPEMRRVIEAVRPAWVIGENVAGFIKMELDRSISDLEGLGYACQAFVIPACAVDARHRRDRTWIVAHGEYRGRTTLDSICARWDAPVVGSEDVPDANGSGREQQWRTKSVRAEQPAIECGSRWQPEPGVGRVAHGIPLRVDRLRGLGNAVVPQVVAEIGKAMMASPGTVRRPTGTVRRL